MNCSPAEFTSILPETCTPARRRPPISRRLAGPISPAWLKWLSLGLLWAVLLGSPASIAATSPHHSVLLLMDGKEAGRFERVSGGGAEIEVIREIEADSPVVRKRPGKTKPMPITLERGQATDAMLAQWVDAALQGKVERKSGSIIYLDREGNEVLRLNLLEAWPAAFQAGPIPDQQGNLAVESFTLDCASVERVAVPGGRRGSAWSAPRGVTVLVDGRELTGVLALSSSGATVDLAGDGSALVEAVNLVLKLDPAADPELHGWFREVSKGKDIRKSISVTVQSNRTVPGRRYTYHEVWPCRWKAPELNSSRETSLVEVLELAVERIERR